MENWKPIFNILFSVFIIILSHYKKWERFKIISVIYFLCYLPLVLSENPFNIPISPSMQDSIQLAIIGASLLLFSIKDKLDDRYYVLAFFILAKSLGIGGFTKH